MHVVADVDSLSSLLSSAQFGLDDSHKSRCRRQPFVLVYDSTRSWFLLNQRSFCGLEIKLASGMEKLYFQVVTLVPYMYCTSVERDRVGDEGTTPNKKERTSMEKRVDRVC